MNKNVSIPQPYAEALCSNACDVLHLDVAPEELPCRCIMPLYHQSDKASV